MNTSNTAVDTIGIPLITKPKSVIMNIIKINAKYMGDNNKSNSFSITFTKLFGHDKSINFNVYNPPLVHLIIVNKLFKYKLLK